MNGSNRGIVDLHAFLTSTRDVSPRMHGNAKARRNDARKTLSISVILHRL